MIIDTQKIETLLSDTAPVSRDAVEVILNKALALNGLDLSDAALLLRAEGPELGDLIAEGALKVKHKVFGSRIVLFAPLYLTNYCSNGCVYCGFRSTNKGRSRNALTPGEAVREALALEEKGFKRALLVLGEDPERGVDYIVEVVGAIYKHTNMRILHVNAPPMSVDEFRKLKAAGVGLYQSFQETYHRGTYAEVHPSGAKKDYDRRLAVMDLSLEAGFNDVGIGALFGLYDYRFEVLSVIAHSMHLFKEFNAHAHTISIPRLRPAEGLSFEDSAWSSAWQVGDEAIKRVVSVFRLSVPTAGVVVTTRESKELREKLIEAGASQLSASSSTAPGGYSKGKSKALEQFSTNDRRALEEVMASIAKSGNMPSLCTTCYRVGRVGESFTETTKSGELSKFCEANAILTLKEFVLDSKANGNEALFEAAIADALERVDDPLLKERISEKLSELLAGERDRFF